MTNQNWWFDGARPWIKWLRFLHLIEDDAVRLSLSGLQLWATTLNNFHAIAFSHDQVQMFYASVAHIGGMIGHAVKRWQTRQP